VLGIVVCLGTFVTPQEAALEVARHKAKEEVKAVAAGHEAQKEVLLGTHLCSQHRVVCCVSRHVREAGSWASPRGA
jgi:hypothetical protein